jgi:cell division control protein 6
MKNLFDDVEYIGQIITREEVLLPNYLPDELLHRDNELEAIAQAIKPMLKKSEPDHLFIHGKSGTGKTSCVKFVIKQLTEHSPSILPVYANCWESATKASIYNKIIEAMELPIPRRGLSNDELFDKIRQYMKNYQKPILLVLDELDGLKHQDLLYLVARANEKQGILFGIIGISNNPEFVSKLDPRTRASLRFSDMEFKKYNEDQLFGIVRDRAQIGLVEGSYDEKLLRKIARSVDDGSARIALELLWKSAKHAENSQKNKITLQDLADCEELAIREGARVTEIEQEILESLKDGSKTSDDLFEQLGKNTSKRQFMNHVYSLQKKNLISTSEETDRFTSKIWELKK